MPLMFNARNGGSIIGPLANSQRDEANSAILTYLYRQRKCPVLVTIPFQLFALMRYCLNNRVGCWHFGILVVPQNMYRLLT